MYLMTESYKIHTLWQIRRFIPENIVLMLCNSLIVLCIVYASNAFYSSLSKTDKNRLAVLCKCAIRCVASVPPLTHTAPVFSRLDVKPVLQIMSRKLLTLMFRMHRNLTSQLISQCLTYVYSTGSAVTRAAAHSNFSLPKITTLSGENRPLFQAVKVKVKVFCFTSKFQTGTNAP